MTIIISTDGSALGNPNGPMGWAWADHAKNAGGTPGHDHDSHGYDAGGATNGTNQIGELCAVLEALRTHPGTEPLLIESDSQYAINCATKWVHGWKRNGWKNSQKKPVKNAPLIKAIDEEIRKRPGAVEFKWVKGHAGNAGNELVDELARTYAGDCRSGAQDGYLPIEGWRSLLESDYAKGLEVPADVQLVLDGKADASSLRKTAATDQNTLNNQQAGSGQQAENDQQPIDRHQADTENTSDTIPAVDTPSATPDTEQPRATGNSGSGLHASGRIRITPPPSSSPYFHGDSITISGTITFSGTVDANGYMQLEGPITIGPQ